MREELGDTLGLGVTLGEMHTDGIQKRNGEESVVAKLLSISKP